MRTILAAVSALTLLAVAYLTLSVVILHPARANFAVWFTLATLIAALDVVTFVAISNVRRWTRIVATAGGAMLSATGVWMVRETLASSHFEGYALVLGSMLVLQGVLTVFTLLRRQAITVDRY